MSDGGSEVNLDRLLELRNAIDRSTPVQSLFIGIGGENEDLRKFATSSESIGFESGFYRQFTREHIAELLKEADEFKGKEKEGFIYTEALASSISQKARDSLDDVQDQLEIFAKAVATQYQEIARNFWHIQADADGLKGKKRDKAVASDLNDRLQGLRGFVSRSFYKDHPGIRQIVVHDVHEKFLKLSGEDTWDSLSDIEFEQWSHVVRCANGDSASCW
jgi:hypothetical protein